MTIEEDASEILGVLFEAPRDQLGRSSMNGPQLQELTQLEPARINDAIGILNDSGLIDLHNYAGTAPFMFGEASLTARGRYEYERAQAALDEQEQARSQIARPVSPVGSPYGFDDEDWEYVVERKSRTNHLHVVMGYQFNSEHFDSNRLVDNLRTWFESAVQGSNAIAGNPQVELIFESLAAGYGEHLFNDIARAIIASDIAVFESSDLNPNVMLELGVALTWGVRVLPIKLEGRPNPPSDISGQTWAAYRDDGRVFVDEDHDRKLLRMVERAARKKLARA